MENNQQMLKKLSLKEESLESEILKACCNESTEKVCNLLNSKPRVIDVEQINRNGSLIIAIAKENVKIVEELLRIGCDPNAKTQMKGLALFIASSNGNTKIINLLLRYGADIRDALIGAIWSENVDVVKKILDFGVDLNEVIDAIGHSALHLAVDRKNLLIVKHFLEHDADANYNGHIGKSPLRCTIDI